MRYRRAPSTWSTSARWIPAPRPRAQPYCNGNEYKRRCNTPGDGISSRSIHSGMTHLITEVPAPRQRGTSSSRSRSWRLAGEELDPRRRLRFEPPASSLEPRALNLEHRASNLEHRASSPKPQAPSSVQGQSIEPGAGLEPRALSPEPRRLHVAWSLVPQAWSLEHQASSIKP